MKSNSVLKFINNILLLYYCIHFMNLIICKVNCDGNNNINDNSNIYNIKTPSSREGRLLGLLGFLIGLKTAETLNYYDYDSPQSSTILMKKFLKYWNGYNIQINIKKNSKNDDVHVKSTTQSTSSLAKFPLLIHETEMVIAAKGNLSSPPQQLIFSGTAIQDMDVRNKPKSKSLNSNKIDMYIINEDYIEKYLNAIKSMKLGRQNLLDTAEENSPNNTNNNKPTMNSKEMINNVVDQNDNNGIIPSNNLGTNNNNTNEQDHHQLLNNATGFTTINPITTNTSTTVPSTIPLKPTGYYGPINHDIHNIYITTEKPAIYNDYFTSNIQTTNNNNFKASFADHKGNNFWTYIYLAQEQLNKEKQQSYSYYKKNSKFKYNENSLLNKTL